MMKGKILALLVHHQTEPLRALKFALEDQFVSTCRARTCLEATRKIEDRNPPHLVFTDRTLPDGTWLDVLRRTVEAPEAMNVIVVAEHVDVSFYLEVIQHGGFDFLAPPFDPLNVWHVVESAAADVLNRRQIQAGLSAHTI
jgi:DNA-binding NtrC family response regulator